MRLYFYGSRLTVGSDCFLFRRRMFVPKTSTSSRQSPPSKSSSASKKHFELKSYPSNPGAIQKLKGKTITVDAKPTHIRLDVHLVVVYFPAHNFSKNLKTSSSFLRIRKELLKSSSTTTKFEEFFKKFQGKEVDNYR